MQPPQGVYKVDVASHVRTSEFSSTEFNIESASPPPPHVGDGDGSAGQGYAFVEFVERAEAEQAQLYLDGGQVRGSWRPRCSAWMG